ncbi:hypothetical protein ACE6H2_009777 [Prunus campanulata]
MADAIFIIELICTCCIVCSFLIGLSEMVAGHLNAKYMEIRKEWRLLDALLKDHAEVLHSADQIKQNAEQLFDSELIHAGWTVQLNAMQQWIKDAGKLVKKMESFRDLKNKRKSPLWLVSFFIYLPEMYFVLDLVKWHNKALQKKPYADIYASLEQSRSKVMSLQDRSSIVVEPRPPPVGLSSDDHQLISSLKKPDWDMSGSEEKQIKKFITDLWLLNAFMKDIEQLKELETNMEKFWVKAAKKTIHKAKDAIATISNPTRANWKSWQKLKKDMTHFDARISKLLESKEKSDFKFIRRESSKSAAHPSDQPEEYTFHHEYQQITGDMDFLSALNNIQNWLNQLPETSGKLSSAVSSLRKELESTQQLFKDTKTTEHASNARHACLEQLKKLAPEAEQYSKTHTEDSEQCPSDFIKQLETTIITLQRRMKVYSIEVTKECCSVIGLEEDIHELVRRLTTNSESEQNSVISILGMKGIGKTTLAKEVYHHKTITNHFEVHCWVSVPAWSNEIDLLNTVGSKVLPDWNQVEQRGKKYWTKKMCKLLKEKRCLLVFDNVLSRETLDALKMAFPVAEMTNGSRILLTTGIKAFADYSNAHDDPNNCIQCYPLRLRTQEESWEFFTQMVHISSSKKELIANAKKVVGKTGGLPLAIFRLGYLLARNTLVTPAELSRSRERISYGRNQSPWLDTKEMNKEELQKGYFELFPGGDFEIPARRLVALWVAKGLVKLKEDEKRTQEEVAHEYLSKLVDRNTIQVVQRKPNGDIKTCCLPSALRELLLRDKGTNSTTRSWSQSTSSDQQHVAYHFDDNDASFSRINGLNTNSANVLNGSYPRSILFFDTREGNKPGEEIGEFLRRGIACGFFAKLEVLDLERVFKPKVPETIGKLKKLKYLGLRWTYIEIIPETIGKLENLETLDMKYTDVRTLPSSIWKLKNLRHLYLNQNCLIKFPHLPSAIFMKNLLTLSGVFMDKANLVKYRLDKVVVLRKLVLAFQLGVPEQKVLAKWIEKLTHLQSLTLSSIDEKGAPQPLKLKPLSKLEQLSSLHFLGRLEKSDRVINGLPESLTHITFSATEIKEVSMPILGKLPKLKSLSLISGSYQGTAIICSKDDFPQLFVLKLWNLNSLEKLDVEEGAMRNLRELEIRSCSNLKTTTGLTHLKILQEIKLTNMPKKCTDDIVNNFAAAVAESAGEIHSPAIKIEYSKSCQMKL